MQTTYNIIIDTRRIASVGIPNPTDEFERQNLFTDLDFLQ